MHRPKIVSFARELGQMVQQALSLRPVLVAMLATAPPGTQADVRAQLDHLLFSGFLRVTPASRLREFPRYLKAAQHRLAKAPADPKRDEKARLEVAAVEEPFWKAMRAEGKTAAPEQDVFRWLLEEFRVSLFAQHLKTAVPVSGKRLSEAWRSRQSTR